MRAQLLLFFLFLAVYSLEAKQIEVCSSCEIKSIKQALEVAEDGDEVIVKKGIYKEHDIKITKSVKIIGIDLPTIDGENKETIFSANTDNFSIEGLHIINVGHSYTKDFAAIYVSRSKHFTLQNNVLENVFFGIINYL